MFSEKLFIKKLKKRKEKMSSKRMFLVLVFFFIQFVKCIKCSYTIEKIEFESNATKYPEKSLKVENKGYFKDFLRKGTFENIFDKHLFFQNSSVHTTSKYKNVCGELPCLKKSHTEGTKIKIKLPFVGYREKEINVTQKALKDKWKKHVKNSSEKTGFLKLQKRIKNNALRNEKDMKNTIVMEHIKNMSEENFPNSSGNNKSRNVYGDESDKNFITEEMINESKHTCDKILKNPFHFLNVTNIHNSRILQLFKKPLENSDTGEYDLFGLGEMGDVSAETLNEALNNIKQMEQWNKLIKELKYVNISKEEVLQKKKSNQLLNVNDHLVPKSDKDNITDVASKNGTGMEGITEFLYQVNELPWPFKNRDVIYEKYSNYDEKHNMFIVLNRSVDDVFMKSENLARIKDYKHFFCIYPQTKDISKKGLKYVIYFYYNADIPRYAQFQIFRQLIPSLIFNLYAYVQHKSNRKNFSELKETRKNKGTPAKGYHEHTDHPFQEKALNEVSHEENETSKKIFLPSSQKKVGKQEETHIDNSRGTFFKKGYFKKVKNLWENKKKSLEKLFFFIYHLF